MGHQTEEPRRCKNNKYIKDRNHEKSIKHIPETNANKMRNDVECVGPYTNI